MHITAFNGIRNQDMTQTNDTIYIFIIIDDGDPVIIGNIKLFHSIICARRRVQNCAFHSKSYDVALLVVHINRCSLFQHRRKLVKFGNIQRILTWMTHFDIKNTTKLDQTTSSNFLPQGHETPRA